MLWILYFILYKKNTGFRVVKKLALDYIASRRLTWRLKTQSFDFKSQAPPPT